MMLETVMAIPIATYAAFLAATLVLNLTPGADMMFTIASAARGGTRAGLAAGLGTSAGVLCHVLLAVIGLSALIAAHPVLLDVVRYAGAAYLLWLAWQAWNDTEGPASRQGRDGLWQAVTRGFVTNILNPKVGLFVLAFLPQFADPAHGPLVHQILILGLLMVAFGAFNIAMIGLAAGTMAESIRRYGRWLNRFSAILFGGLAARIILD